MLIPRINWGISEHGETYYCKCNLYILIETFHALPGRKPVYMVLTTFLGVSYSILTVGVCHVLYDIFSHVVTLPPRVYFRLIRYCKYLRVCLTIAFSKNLSIPVCLRSGAASHFERVLAPNSKLALNFLFDILEFVEIDHLKSFCLRNTVST